VLEASHRYRPSGTQTDRKETNLLALVRESERTPENASQHANGGGGNSSVINVGGLI